MIEGDDDIGNAISPNFPHRSKGPRVEGAAYSSHRGCEKQDSHRSNLPLHKKGEQKTQNSCMILLM